MGKSSRQKGKVGERELATTLRRLGFLHAHRTAQFIGSGRAGRPDVEFGDPKIQLRAECKYGDAVAPKTVYDNFKKLRDETPWTHIPVMFMKRVTKANSLAGVAGPPWLALVNLEHLTLFAQRWLTGLGWSCTPPAKPAKLAPDGGLDTDQDCLPFDGSAESVPQ